MDAGERAGLDSGGTGGGIARDEEETEAMMVSRFGEGESLAGG